MFCAGRMNRKDAVLCDGLMQHCPVPMLLRERWGWSVDAAVLVAEARVQKGDCRREKRGRKRIRKGKCLWNRDRSRGAAVGCTKTTFVISSFLYLTRSKPILSSFLPFSPSISASSPSSFFSSLYSFDFCLFTSFLLFLRFLPLHLLPSFLSFSFFSFFFSRFYSFLPSLLPLLLHSHLPPSLSFLSFLHRRAKARWKGAIRCSLVRSLAVKRLFTNSRRLRNSTLSFSSEWSLSYPYKRKRMCLVCYFRKIQTKKRKNICSHNTTKKVRRKNEGNVNPWEKISHKAF